MAKTLIGQLILRLRTEGLGEAEKLKTTMRGVEETARRLGASGTASWGVGFQRNIEKLKLTQDEIGKVQQSWIAMHDAMKRRNVGSALRSSEVSHWKTQTITELAKARSEMDRHFAEVERNAVAHGRRLAPIVKASMVTLGAYSAPYFGGMLGAEALRSSSEQRREFFRMNMAGIEEKDRDRIFSRSEELSTKYPSVPIASVMEASRNAWAFMGDVDRAMGVVETMMKSYTVTQSTRGTDAAVHQLTQFLRGLDRLGVNVDGQKGIDEVNKLIDAATKAMQVDPDFDPASFFPFARTTKVAGPALSNEFLARAPAYIQDMGGQTTGNSLAMGFRSFLLEAVGSAGGKRYLAERERIGIRDDNGITEPLLLGSNPDEWVLKHLVPALERDGIDMSDATAVAAAVGKLSGNTTATGFFTTIITQRDQIKRLLELYQNAQGVESADDVRFNDPFVGYEAFKKSLENLSAALIPIDAINAGINKMADGVNVLARIANDNPALTALGIGSAGYGAYAGGKFALGKMSDAFGLKSSAIALDASALALQRAAAALGGSAAVDGAVPDGGKGKAKPGRGGGWKSIFGLGGLAAATAIVPDMLGDTPGDTFDEKVDNQRKAREGLEQGIANMREWVARQTFGAGAGIGAMAAPPGGGLAERGGRVAPAAGEPDAARFGNPVATVGLDTQQAQVDAATARQQLSDALKVQGTVVLDLSQANQAADGLLAKLSRAMGIAGQIGSVAAASTANVNLGVEMRRNFSD